MSIQNSDSFTLIFYIHYLVYTVKLACNSLTHSFIRSLARTLHVIALDRLAPEFILQTPNYNIYLAWNERRKNTQKCVKSLPLRESVFSKKTETTPDTLGYKFHLYRRKDTHTHTQCVHKGNKKNQAKTPNDKSIKQ